MSSHSFPAPPGAVIGILGGGQLGRMLALAAARLGFECAILSPDPEAPAGRVAAHSITAAYDDDAALGELARLSAVVTFEFENVPARVIEKLAALGAPVAPGARALAVGQDRAEEKRFFLAAGVPTAEFAEIESAADIVAALPRLGTPALLKTRREGYDGKGQAWVDGPDGAEAAFEVIGRHSAVLEARVPFARELSVIGARGRDGAISLYPLTENHHEHGVLRTSIAPARASRATQAEAERIVRSVLERLDYVGVIGVELFELADGELKVNEFAPRVHNSGHWTLDGCEVDQFEQHIRAVAGWPLGPTAPLAAVEMTNLLGPEAHDWAALAADPQARVWLYGKREGAPSKAGSRRKMGHVNRLSLLPKAPPED
jgi:5-(carboxyamino)imidazole ribonucleotide synthase